MCGADGYESVEGLSYEDVHSVLRKRLERVLKVCYNQCVFWRGTKVANWGGL